MGDIEQFVAAVRAETEFFNPGLDDEDIRLLSVLRTLEIVKVLHDADWPLLPARESLTNIHAELILLAENPDLSERVDRVRPLLQEIDRMTN